MVILIQIVNLLINSIPLMLNIFFKVHKIQNIHGDENILCEVSVLKSLSSSFFKFLLGLWSTLMLPDTDEMGLGWGSGGTFASWSSSFWSGSTLFEEMSWRKNWYQPLSMTAIFSSSLFKIYELGIMIKFRKPSEITIHVIKSTFDSGLWILMPIDKFTSPVTNSKDHANIVIWRLTAFLRLRFCFDVSDKTLCSLGLFSSLQKMKIILTLSSSNNNILDAFHFIYF